MAIITPALFSIETRFLPVTALRHADTILEHEGYDPVKAFEDLEINRHHRAIAIGWLASLADSGSGLYTNLEQFEYVNHLEQKKGEN